MYYIISFHSIKDTTGFNRILHRLSATKKRRKKMFLFSDAFNTFYFWLFGVGLIVKDHSDNDSGNPAAVIRWGSFICTICSHRQESIYHDLTQFMEH